MSTFNASTGLSTPANSPAPSAGTPAAASASAPAARSPSYVNSDVRRPRPRVSLRLVVVLALLAAPFLYFGYVILDQSLHGGVTNRGSYYDVDLKSLGYFPFDANKDGIDHVDAFELVYSIQKCCFNGPPRVQERVYATAGKNATVNYYPQIVRVVGTLHVTARRNEVGAIEKLYELDVESVDPA
jgi:hypothetical protein